MASSSNHENLIGQIIGGRYEVLRLIGKGGMGNIYEVRNTRLGRSFALKTLSRDATSNTKALQRFRREADVIARIKHPHIVEVVDWEALDDGSPAMVMEYLKGEDLDRRLEAGPLAWPVLARIADQMLAALAVAHASGIVHRDLKPQNVFLAVDDAGGEAVKLLDFGVSKVRDSKSVVTTDERLLGTPSYMSPEQADARSDDIGPASDVWAVGVLLHQMATGEVPFDAPSVPSILYKICHGAPASILEKRPDAPAAFVALVTATLVRDIAARIPDASALRQRLREALHDVEGVQFQDPLPAPAAGATATAPKVRAALTENGTVQLTSPSIVARRKLAPVALAVGALAAILIAITVVVALRDPPVRRALASPPPAPHEEPVAATTPADASVETSVPAGSATGSAAVVVQEPLKPTPRVPVAPKVDRGSAASVTVTPPPVQPPAVVPAKKQCAKDDAVCLFGDGT